MKVLTFSKHFPKGHPKAGQPTHFVQKILHSLVYPAHQPATNVGWPPKFHTIRASNRWKVGDMASLRVWADKPYRSKQIEFAQVEVKKVFDFVISDGNYSINTIQIGSFIPNCDLQQMANNDGLHVDDFWSWFNIHPKNKHHVFSGQIICWSDKIEYGNPSSITPTEVNERLNA